MAKPTRLLAWALAASAVAVLAVFGLSGSRAGSASGRAAPALPSEVLAGGGVTLSQLLAQARGHAALVVFWASWCEPCAREAPALARLARSPADRGRIVGVNWSDEAGGARSFIRRFAWTFPNMRDSNGKVGNEYRITGLPTSFVVDRNGRIRTVLRGPQTEASFSSALRAAEAA